MAKQEKWIVTTPKVELGYGYLRTPDTKFNPDGDYKQDFFMTSEQAKKFCEAIESDPRATVKGKKAKVKFTKVDGLFKFKTKQHAKFTYKGEEISVQPRVFYVVDGKTAEYPADAPIPYAGSEAQIEVEVIPFEGFGGGLSFRLRAVRLTKIVEGKKSGSTGDWDEVPEGYTSEAIAKPFAEDTEVPSDDDEIEEDDDGGEERW